MSLTWIREPHASWDAHKQAIIGTAPAGTFDARFAGLESGDALPNEWWRVEEDGAIVGYGWLDTVWGDAEIVLVTAEAARGRGVGAFVLEHLEREAQAHGLNYLYNTVRPTHPERDDVTAWLVRRGFGPSTDGTLRRAVAAAV
ncbi:MAG: GNAT family N-acetyltransferase [Planctomycetota bacterium]